MYVTDVSQGANGADAGNDDIVTVKRNIQGIPCKTSTLGTHAKDTVGFLEVTWPGATDGVDYQIDANRLKAGTAYFAGALGDMLEDVNRGLDSTAGANRLKAGTAYFAGALGDMLEDVNRGLDSTA